MRRALGVDFGGTSVKAGVVNEQGAIEARDEFPTEGLTSHECWMEAVERSARRMGLPAGLRGGVEGIGVGVPGFVDFGRGFIHDLTNVPGWTHVPLADLLQRRFGLPAIVDNDANAMALGECRFGAGREYRYAVFATLGTGVGGGLVLDGRLYRGAHSMAGEIGHITIDRLGVKYPQGRGGLECYVGNRRLVERCVKALRRGRASRLTDMVGGEYGKITVRLIAEAAGQGDELSLEVFDYMADCLAAAFSTLTYVLQPEVFIIGGGVAAAGDILFGPLRRHLDARLSPHFSKRIDVRPAALGNDAGMVGAAALVFEQT